MTRRQRPIHSMLEWTVMLNEPLVVQCTPRAWSSPPLYTTDLDSREELQSFSVLGYSNVIKLTGDCNGKYTTSNWYQQLPFNNHFQETLASQLLFPSFLLPLIPEEKNLCRKLEASFVQTGCLSVNQPTTSKYWRKLRALTSSTENHPFFIHEMIHDAQLWLCELAALRKNTVDVQKPTVQITTNSRQHRYYDEVTDLFCRTDVASYMQGLTPFNCLRVTVSTEFICSGYKKNSNGTNLYTACLA